MSLYRLSALTNLMAAFGLMIAALLAALRVVDSAESVAPAEIVAVAVSDQSWVEKDAAHFSLGIVHEAHHE